MVKLTLSAISALRVVDLSSKKWKNTPKFLKNAEKE